MFSVVMSRSETDCALLRRTGCTHSSRKRSDAVCASGLGKKVTRWLLARQTRLSALGVRLWGAWGRGGPFFLLPPTRRGPPQGSSHCECAPGPRGKPSPGKGPAFNDSVYIHMAKYELTRNPLRVFNNFSLFPTIYNISENTLCVSGKTLSRVGSVQHELPQWPVE